MMYTCTDNILKSAVIAFTVGVRQGAPTSCLLFVMYIDKMIKMLKRYVPQDGFLGSLHALMLMDDTVILATSKEMCEKKFEIVLKYCKEYGMEINVKKTKLFVISGNTDDEVPVTVNNQTVNYRSQYLYLGAWFTDDEKSQPALALHYPANQETVNKFAIFCAVNLEMHFHYK